MFLVPLAVFATANWVHIPLEESKVRRQFGATYGRTISFRECLLFKRGIE